MDAVAYRTTELDANMKSKTDVQLTFRIFDVIIRATKGLKLGKKAYLFPYILVIPALLLIGTLALGILFMFWRGFHSFSPEENLQGGLSFDHYRKLFFGYGSSFYLKTLGRTILISIVVTITSIIFALPAAYAIAGTQNRRTRRFALIMLLVPFMMGESVRTIGWFLILGNNGALSWVTSFFGKEISLLGSIIAIWLGMLQVMFPIATLVLLPAMTKIDPDLERAAQSMGAKSMQVWLRIILPLSRPGILSSSLVVLTLSMTEFAIPRILGQGKHPFVANTIQQIYFERGNVNFGSAFSTVLLFTVVLMVLTIGYFGKSRA